MQLARRKEIYEALHPQAKHGGDRKSVEKNQGAIIASWSVDLPTPMPRIAPFDEDTAAKTGMAARTVSLKTQIGAALTSAAPRLHNTPVADNQKELLNLARLDALTLNIDTPLSRFDATWRGIAFYAILINRNAA